MEVDVRHWHTILHKRHYWSILGQNSIILRHDLLPRENMEVDVRHWLACMSAILHGDVERCVWVMSHIHESCLTYEWVMSHIWMRRIMHVCHLARRCGALRLSYVICPWVMSHVWTSHVTCRWVFSHTWMSHVSHMNTSCHACLPLCMMMLSAAFESYHKSMSHVSRVDEWCLTYACAMSYICLPSCMAMVSTACDLFSTFGRVMSDIWMSLVTYQWVMSHIWMRHVPHMNASCHACLPSCMTMLSHTCEWELSHIWISHVSHMNEYCLTYEWVMSCMTMLSAACELCFTFEWVMLQMWMERWGAGVETQKNVRGEIEGWGRVPFNEPYAPSLSTIYDGA